MKNAKEWLSKTPKRLRFGTIILALGAVLLIAFLFTISNFNIFDSNILYRNRFDVLDEGWTMSIGDQEEAEVTLPYWVEAKPGEIITLSYQLPNPLPANSTMVTRNYHQVLRAYINGAKVFEFPKDASKLTGTIITDDWCMINISKFAPGRVLKLELDTGISGFNGFINPLLFGEDNSIIANLRSTYALPFGLSLTLIAIGLMLIVVASVYTKDSSETAYLLLGFIFITIGIWFADRAKMPVFMVGSNVKFFMAFSGIMLTPLLISLYIGERFKKYNQTVINILIICDVIFTLVISLILASKSVPVQNLIVYVYIAILISIIYAMYLMWDYAHGQTSKRLNRVQLNASRMELMTVIILLIGSAISFIWDEVSPSNYNSYQRNWTGIGNIQMISVIIFAFFQLIILIYNGYYSAVESEITQKKLHDSQLQLMMGQIQPHFMFNTLSSIRTLIKVDPDLAYKMVYDFSNYLRANVDNLTNLDGIKFAAEVNHIQSYVGIEKIRFGDRLDVEFDIQEDDFLVPPLSIQPLVENAIKHGVMKKVDGGTVWLRSYSTDTAYIVEVEDNGVGIAQERLDFLFRDSSDFDFDSDTDFASNLTGNGSENHVSTGMRNIIMRLDEIAHAKLNINTEEGKGSLMRVTFPKESNEKQSSIRQIEE